MTWEYTITPKNHYTPGCLLDYSYFKEDYKLLAIDLSKQQTLDADPKVQQCFSLLKKQKIPL